MSAPRVACFWDKPGGFHRTHVLIHALSCVGHCKFCSYTTDNVQNYRCAVVKNEQILREIPLDRPGLLDVAPSASIFEVPLDTLWGLKKVVEESDFDEIRSECHWFYRNLIANFTGSMPILCSVKIGIETFDNAVRRQLGKDFDLTYREVLKYTDCITLIVGVTGQTENSVREDILIAGENFRYVDLNVFDTNYGPPVLANETVLGWFKDEGLFLAQQFPSIKVWSNMEESFING